MHQAMRRGAQLQASEKVRAVPPITDSGAPLAAACQMPPAITEGL